jgi:isopentenyldiphosphate isomerase
LEREKMTEAFVAFVRHEEKLLLLKRNSSTEHFPDLWDGVWGVADTPEEVLDRVA